MRGFEENIEKWLETESVSNLLPLWEMSRKAQAGLGGEVHLRALVNISNVCSMNCSYCGLRSGNKHLARYIMTRQEILDSAQMADDAGFKTIVLQSGCSKLMPCRFVSDIVEWIKVNTNMALTLSLGERNQRDIRDWRIAGADRYLLKVETTDEGLFKELHPPGSKDLAEIVRLLKYMREIGYEVGSGIMYGLPGQTVQMLASDLRFLRFLDLDMVANSPYIHNGMAAACGKAGDVVASDVMAMKVVAITRILYPDANIPVTGALQTLFDDSGVDMAIRCGANVIMIDMTPMPYMEKYMIYPKSVKPYSERMRTGIVERLCNAGLKVSCDGGSSRRFMSRARREGV